MLDQAEKPHHMPRASRWNIEVMLKSHITVPSMRHFRPFCVLNLSVVAHTHTPSCGPNRKVVAIIRGDNVDHQEVSQSYDASIIDDITEIIWGNRLSSHASSPTEKRKGSVVLRRFYTGALSILSRSLGVLFSSPSRIYARLYELLCGPKREVLISAASHDFRKKLKTT